MDISEKDLYKYIMYPEQLEHEKFEYIKSNKEDFKSQLDLLEQLKESIQTDVPPNIVNNIINKINDPAEKTFELFKVDKFKNNSEYSLVSESHVDYNTPNTYYLEDSESQVQLKIDIFNSKSVVSLFCSFDVEDSELLLKFLPSNYEMVINYDEQPITINKILEFNSIQLIVK